MLAILAYNVSSVNPGGRHRGDPAPAGPALGPTPVGYVPGNLSRSSDGDRHLDQGVPMEWSQRSAIVTGGAGGLGAATVRRLTALGLRVVIFDRAVDAGTALAGELGTGAAVGGDVNSDADVGAAIDAASELAPLAVVVNVAGGGMGGRTLSRDNAPLDIEKFRATIELNTVGTFNVTRLSAAAWPPSSPMSSANVAWSSTRPRSPATRGRPDRWPTARPRRRSSG